MNAPGILNLIGGIFCLIFGALLAVAGSVATLVPFVGLVVGGVFWAVALWGLVVGVLLVVSAAKETQKNWGIIGLIFSILGLITVQGFIIGPILGIIGSALAISRSKEAKKK